MSQSVSVSVKKLSDLQGIFGLKLTTTVKTMRRSFMKRLPFSVRLTDTKPAFYLDDGGMLRCYAVNLVSGEIIGERYCGSADTAINHKEQFNETAKAPENHALFFVETYPSSKNHPWVLTVVSPNITSQIK